MSDPGTGQSPTLAFPVPPELIDAIASRAADLARERAGIDDDSWLRGAERIAAYIDSPASRVYALAACKPPRIPVHRDGSNLLARRSELDEWVLNGGGKRP